MAPKEETMMKENDGVCTKRRFDSTTASFSRSSFEEFEDYEDEEMGRIESSPIEVKDKPGIERIKEDQEGEENDETKRRIPETLNDYMDVLYDTWQDGHWMFQVIGTLAGCFWTYSLTHQGGDALVWDGQIAIMVVLVLTGVACPVSLFAPVGVGVFAGAVPKETVPTFPSLLLLAIVAALVWRLVDYTGFIAGFGGRMGTATFIAMNLTAVAYLIPTDQLQGGWSRYGQADWSLVTLETGLVYMASVVILSVLGATFRLRARTAVHPYLVPSAVALTFQLVTATFPMNSELAAIANIGFSTGAYVAMTATTNLKSETEFFLAGIVAGLWGLLLQPMFVGFAGKAGFTSFLGFSTCKYFVMPAMQCWKRKPKQQQHTPQEEQ